ncbi:hypothetical protein JCM6882_000527 [Rhodosporidiobolus microsporus]
MLNHLPAPRHPTEEAREILNERITFSEDYSQHRAHVPRDLETWTEQLQRDAVNLEIFERKAFYERVQELLPDQDAVQAEITKAREEVAMEVFRLKGAIPTAEAKCRLASGGNESAGSRYVRSWLTEEAHLGLLRGEEARAKARGEELKYIRNIVKWELKNPERAKREKEQTRDRAKTGGSELRSHSRRRSSTTGLGTSGPSLEGEAEDLGPTFHPHGTTMPTILHAPDARREGGTS